MTRDWTRMARFGLWAGAGGLALAFVASLGTGVGLWHFGIGFLLLQGALLAAVAAVLLGLAGATIALRRKKGRRMLEGVAGAALGLPLILYLLSFAALARSLPAIHDISTDLESPPEFSVIARRIYSNDEMKSLGTIAEQHEKQKVGYPDIQPVFTDLDPADAIRRADSLARKMGWEIAVSDPEHGHLEATATTLWFRFKDDVVIRATQSGDKTRLDIRSVSRVGISDIGKNAERIRKFQAAFQGKS